MKATTVNLLNTEFLGAKDGDTYYLAVSNVEKALGLRSRSLREILESKKFKAMIEGASSLYTYGEKSFTYKNRKYSAIPVRTFVQLISFEAKVHRSELAIDFLSALANDSLERLIDAALGVLVNEDTRASRLNDLFLQLREESRVGFKPLFTNWLKGKEDIIWPKEVARLKKAAGIAGSVSVNNMKLSELVKWANAHTAYNAYRHAGKTHEETLKLMYDITTQDVELFDFTKDN